MSTLALPKRKAVGLGTFGGVYLPSLLTMFGVIMYLRLGLIIGSVGLIWALVIVVLASSITFITALSIATSSTNMIVKGGGAYFLISRAFGKEIGAAIGLPLYFAQAMGIAFYIAGFVESFSSLFPQIPPAYFGVGVLALLTILAYTSASLAIKAQGIILCLIVASLISFFLGTESTAATLPVMTASKIKFWGAFALFFPAVTGIEAGVSMSGDLRNPSKSLSRGVVAAVVTGLIVYLVMCWYLAHFVSREELVRDPFIMQHLARWGWVIIMGLWGATLSSALGAVLGAPRTLQALAQDGVMPRFLAKGFGPLNEPRIATLFTFLISSLAVYFGRIDIIAPILTMFFLMSYGMLNLAAGLEGFVQNPSWRPTFQIPATISFVGASLCIMAMFMINPGNSFLAIFLVIAVYFIAMRSSLNRGWDDIRQGILFLFSRLAIYRLAEDQTSARSWRPNFLVFTNGYRAPQSLLKFTSRITKGKGLLIIASIFQHAREHIDLDTIKMRIKEMFKRKKIEALVTVSRDTNPIEGMKRLVDNCGLGPLRPNTVVIGDAVNAEKRETVTQLIMHAHKKHRNSVVIVGNEEEDFIENSLDDDEPSRIDIWWDDENKENSKLMLVLAHMHQCSKGYGAMSINLKCTVPNETAREHRQHFFDEFLHQSRFHVSTQVYVKDEDQPEGAFREHFSSDANLVLCGLLPPQPEEDFESYLNYYRDQIKSHKKLHHLVYVLSAETVDLSAIFN